MITWKEIVVVKINKLTKKLKNTPDITGMQTSALAAKIVFTDSSQNFW
jgi:hypothetical protein